MCVRMVVWKKDLSSARLTRSLTFRHLTSDFARIGYATEGAFCRDFFFFLIRAAFVPSSNYPFLRQCEWPTVVCLNHYPVIATLTLSDWSAVSASESLWYSLQIRFTLKILCWTGAYLDTYGFWNSLTTSSTNNSDIYTSARFIDATPCVCVYYY